MIYLMADKINKKCKIGWSNNPHRRLKTLQCGSAFPLELLFSIDGEKETEKYLHKLFAEYRLLGEWFYMENKILNWFRNPLPPTETKSVQMAILDDGISWITYCDNIGEAKVFGHIIASVKSGMQWKLNLAVIKTITAQLLTNSIRPRTAYREVVIQGKGVIEYKDEKAKNEFLELYNEIVSKF